MGEPKVGEDERKGCFNAVGEEGGGAWRRRGHSSLGGEREDVAMQSIHSAGMAVNPSSGSSFSRCGAAHTPFPHLHPLFILSHNMKNLTFVSHPHSPSAFVLYVIVYPPSRYEPRNDVA
jgi:hypothetical protein